MKRLVLLVEGEGDAKAVPSLLHRLLPQLPEDLQGQLLLDEAAMKVGGVHQITGKRQEDFSRHLGNACKRPKLGAVLLVLDGDAKEVEKQQFCPVTLAQTLARRAKAVGAGVKFSFAAVFLQQEYESLLLSVANQLSSLKPDVPVPPRPEEAPRDAKGWLDRNLEGGYLPADNQLELTRSVQDWTLARTLRCFKRLENALLELASAIATGQHISSPTEASDA